MSEAGVWLKLAASIGALALGAAAVAIVTVLAHRTPGPAGATNTPAAAPPSTPTTTAASQPTEPAFPAPPSGAVVFSRQAGDEVVALGVVPGRRMLLQASVVGGQGQGVEGLPVSFRVGSKVAAAQPCGPGCYRASSPTTKTPKAVEVRIGGKRPLNWSVPLPRPWPPRDGSALVARASRTFRNLHSLTTDDSLSSGLGRTIYTHWTIGEPDRLTYQVKKGPAAVIIGDTRWDKLPGQKWVKSAQTPIHQPTPFWVTWTDAHVIGETPSAWRITFFDPKTPGWYEVLVAKKSRLPMEMRMQAAAHFMHQRYGNFNVPVKIVPPK